MRASYQAPDSLKRWQRLALIVGVVFIGAARHRACFGSATVFPFVPVCIFILGRPLRRLAGASDVATYDGGRMGTGDSTGA